jgi:NADH-quinone oxidoreductase subunit G
VLLPIAPFTETPGTFVNAEGRMQSFHAVVKPLGEARPAWKVLRVLANMLQVPGFDENSTQDVLAKIVSTSVVSGDVLPGDWLSNEAQGKINLEPASVEPTSASIYQLDGLVRRSSSLQMTADARAATLGEPA